MMTPAITRITRFCALALIVAAPAVATAEKAGYYRWKDDKGQFQATQQPPADRPSEYIRLSTGKSQQMAPGETVEVQEEKAAKAAAPKKIPGSMQAVPDKNPEKCKEAEGAKSVLDSNARIREKTESGEYRYLSPEEINEQKRLATESMEVYCEPAAPAQ